MTSTTFTIIKPDAVAAGYAPEIFRMIAEGGFRVKARREVHLTRRQAERFYGVHKGKEFFAGLVDFMTSGPIVVAVLESDGPDAVARFRSLVGNTDPSQAAPGTIRRRFGQTVRRNAIHASDSTENARTESHQFFTPEEM